MEMTTAEASKRLGVTQRQIQRLTQAGTLAQTRRVGQTMTVDAASVAKLADLQRHRGRPWSPPTAWAALWRLSGLDTPWVDRQTGRRMEQRLRHVTPAQLAWVCRLRARPMRYRASQSFLQDLLSRVRPSGASGLNPARDLMHPPTGQLDGYVTCGEHALIVNTYHLVEDHAGNVTLRITDDPTVTAWSGVMPAAVVGLDLLDSPDVRDNTAGRHLLEGLLP